jgi:hypothetical protein
LIRRDEYEKRKKDFEQFSLKTSHTPIYLLTFAKFINDQPLERFTALNFTLLKKGISDPSFYRNSMYYSTAVAVERPNKLRSFHRNYSDPKEFQLSEKKNMHGQNYNNNNEKKKHSPLCNKYYTAIRSLFCQKTRKFSQGAENVRCILP